MNYYPETYDFSWGKAKDCFSLAIKEECFQIFMIGS
jgi:hypothetical protein